MYQIDNTKRYDFYVQHSLLSTSYKNCTLVSLAQNIVVIKDEKGKEHIITGNFFVCIDEV